MADLNEYTVPVSGAEDLEFSGKELAHAKGWCTDERGLNREEELRVFETEKGKYIASRQIDHGEETEDIAAVYDSKEELIRDLPSFIHHTNAAKTIYAILDEGHNLRIKSTRRID